MFRKGDQSILVQHSEDEVGHYFAMRRNLRVVNVLLWLSGALLLAIGVYLNVDLSSASLLLDLSALYAVNVLLVVSGSVVILSSTLGCFDCFFRRGISLCTMSYMVTLVFVLQCILATLAFTWRVEVGSFVGKELDRLIKEGNNTSTAKFSAMDSVQKRFHCCGANSSADWGKSAWKKDLPLSCCKTSVSAQDCSLKKPGNIYDKGCVGALRGSYETCFLIAGVVSVFTAVFQFVCFHVANYLLFTKE